MRALFAAAAVLALAACNKPAATPPPAATAPAAPAATPTAAPVNPVVTITTYACADTAAAAPAPAAPPAGESLEVGYPDTTSAVLVWRGHAYTLKLAPAGNGVRYTGYGMQWWTKTPTRGALAALKPGEELASEGGLDCVASGQASTSAAPLTPGVLPGVAPPAPGTPGGLPADKTPISEAPFSPTSAQGAANVVQTYYAFLEKRSSADAAKLRADGAAENLSPYAEYHAQVGAPGAIQGGAGSLVVEVPVVVYGRLAGGGAFNRSGKVVLRRINDVPGSTEAQRQWHIERIDLKDVKPSPPAKPRAGPPARAPAPAPH